MSANKLKLITVHGRFQPPMHINHWNYISQAFDLAEHVQILITNPYQNETVVPEATHRNSKENNPFTYDQRVQIFKTFFANKDISPSRFSFKPFDITNPSTWPKALSKDVPNLVNVYGDWSQKKLENFITNGYKAIKLSIPKSTPISGTQIREVIRENISIEVKSAKLISLGYLPEAIPGLFSVLKYKYE